MTENTGGATRNGTAIHLSLQGKGGVGKSFVASIVAQYLIERGHDVQCIDTDPVNHTLSQYKGLPVRLLQLLCGSRVDERKFDVLLETFLKEKATFIVDNGASTFVALWNFMLESQVIQKLAESGIPLYLHTVITGGLGLTDTIDGFNQLAETMKDRRIVIWFNEYFGPVDWEGKSFIDTDLYKVHEAKVVGTVTIPRRTPDTFGRDIEEMIRQKQTFREALMWEGSYIMTKQRIKIVRDHLFEQLDKLEFTASAVPSAPVAGEEPAKSVIDRASYS
jgi:hypothetical protein